MSILLAFGTVLLTHQTTKTVRIPVFDFDSKGKFAQSFYPAALPAGFSEVRTGKGEFTSKAGTILFSVARSVGAVPVVQRNPNAKPEQEWTTIRLTNWIGYRNTVGSSEVYVLNWTRYRLNVALKYKNKKDVPTLRKGLNALVDSLTIK
jgi:hypothetical protein